tara:strand:+ start:2934 stop:3974 length:1041 start_codon:yes stop_codon:yes gene_type:complete
MQPLKMHYYILIKKGYLKLKKILIISLLILTYFSLNITYANNITTIAPLIKDVKDSVVSIKNIKSNSNTNTPISGSGFIISQEGYIVTNYHVIKDSKNIKVYINSKIYDAELIGYDHKIDIALLKINSDKLFSFVEFADSSKIEVGDYIVAIGNPYGLGDTVTTGIISALNRDINMTPYDNFIQLDAAINKGNSGGPTFNMEGKVIGVNTAIISPSGGNIGLGFSIPSNEVKKSIEDIKKYGYVKRSWIGVNLQALNENMLKAIDLTNYYGAVIITNISKDSPATKYDLRIGDIIIGINNKKINGVKDLIKIISKINVNELISLQIIRKNKKLEIDLQTAQWPQIV